MILKKILLLIFSLNLVLPDNPVIAHKDKNEFDKAFFLGGQGMICAIYLIGDLSEIQAKKYIGFNRTYTLKSEVVDIKVKNYAEDYRFTGSNKECNRLID